MTPRMTPLDPIQLSRELGRIEDAAFHWRHRLRVEPLAQDNPFISHRHLLCKHQFEQLVEGLPAEDPLRLPLLRWTFRLMQERVHHAWITLSHQRRYGDKHPLTQPVRTKQTLAEMLAHLLSDVPERREPWLDTFAEQGQLAFEAEATLWQRRAEMTRRLGHAHPDEFESPTEDAYAIAWATLDETEECARHALRGERLAWLRSALEPIETLRFPAHLNERTLAGWFRQTRFLEDLRLPPWPLPAPIAPASFVRALDELGQAWRRAAAPAQQPFVIARDPYGLDESRYGFALAQLVLSPAFLQRHLDCTRNQTRDARRKLAHVYLIELRVRALKVLLRQPALEGAAAWTEHHQELTSRALGRELPAGTTALLPRLDPRDPQRLLGALQGAALHQRLREVYDEDWYRNPRAVDQLRSDAALPPAVTVRSDEALLALRAYRDELTAWLV